MKITALNITLSWELIHNCYDSEDVELSNSYTFILKFLKRVSIFTSTFFYKAHRTCPLAFADYHCQFRLNPLVFLRASFE